jgi:hypothetical protein
VNQFKRFVVSLSLLAASGCGTPDLCVEGSYTETRWTHTYWVHPSLGTRSVQAHVPPGQYFLLRSGEETHAVRFFNLRGAPTQGDLYGCSSYEVYEVRPWARAAPQAPSLRRRGEVSSFLGPHPGFHLGRTRVEGTFYGTYYYHPAQIAVGDAVEVALTAWTSIEAVNPTHPRLKWFGYRSGTRNGDSFDLSPGDLP